METKDAIFNRRSCREYTEQKVSNEILKDLLHAAFSAPTAVRKHRTKDKPVVGHYS